MAIEEQTPSKGVFNDSLSRTASQIRKDRAEAISEGTQMLYRRKIEDLELKLKGLKRDQEAALDFTPSTTTQIISVADFNTTEFVDKDTKYVADIHNTEILLEKVKARYEYLFGK